MTLKKSGFLFAVCLLILISLSVLLFTGCSKEDREKLSPAPILSVHFIDVGQGDSILIRTPSQKSVLIDAGENKYGPKVLNYLKAQNVKFLDMAMASHPHSDHIGGMTYLLKNIPIKRFLDSGVDYPSLTLMRMLETIKEKSVPFQTARSGQQIEVDLGIHMQILHPDPEMLRKTRSDANSNCIVSKLTYNKVSFLFMGDAENETERHLLKKNLNLKSQILKVAHHGSKYSNSPEFINAVSPEVAVISCGLGNSYGHPAPTTLKCLQDSDTTVYRTDKNGDIVIMTDGVGYTIQIDRKEVEPKAMLAVNKPR